MPRYTVENNEGKRVTFEWQSPTLPTDSDMEEVFSAAKEIKPGTKSIPRRIAERVVKSPAFPIAGSIIGGTLGSAGGVGVASVPGAVAGAGLGGAAGESYRQLAARALGMDTPGTMTEAAEDIATEGVAQAAGEAVGMGIVGPVLKYGGKIIKKPLGDLFQIVTKIKPDDAATLFKNPKAILPGQWKKAQAGWRAAAEKAGLPVDDVSPEIINALKKDARSTVFDTFEKLQAGEKLTGGQLQTAKQALDIALMPAAKTERNKPLVALFSKMRTKFTDEIGKISPELAKANKDYGVAKAGSRFRSLFPRNLDDSPAYFRTVLPSLALGSGYASQSGDPVGGVLRGAALTTAASPLAIGSLISGAGLLAPVTPYGRRALTSGLASYVKGKAKRKD